MSNRIISATTALRSGQKFVCLFVCSFVLFQKRQLRILLTPVRKQSLENRMFIGPCIIVIVEELETNLMSLVMFITLNTCSTYFEH